MGKQPETAAGVERSEKAAALTVSILDSLIKPPIRDKVGAKLWNGTAWPDERARPATLVLKHPYSLRSMFLPGTELALAEAYLYDDFDIEGDIEQVFDLADALARETNRWTAKLRIAADLLRLPSEDKHPTGTRGPARLSGKQHSLERDRQAVRYHYDVSNDFCQLFLDTRMVYSCAYFHSASDSLDAAQEHKLDYICRKLRLRPGMRLLDIGCGWGGLILYAVEKYGVDATGITLSQPQADLANRRIREAGQADHCRARVVDYREVASDQPFDALVSVGMFEHVGAGMLPTYFAKARDLLKPGGVFLNHGIGRRATDEPARGPSFTDTYVFPDGELEPIHLSLQAAEACGFEVRDVENLREHYALTLRRWVHRLEGHHDEALKFVDEPTYRVWRLFMSGSIHGFVRGRLNVYQSLLALPEQDGSSDLPLTREDWYR